MISNYSSPNRKREGAVSPNLDLYESNIGVEEPKKEARLDNEEILRQINQPDSTKEERTIDFSMDIDDVTEEAKQDAFNLDVKSRKERRPIENEEQLMKIMSANGEAIR